MSVKEYAPRVFVYGTLKRGFPNYDILKPYSLSAEKAVLPGLMWAAGGGYFPVVEIPLNNILLFGQSNVAEDLVTVERQAVSNLFPEPKVETDLTGGLGVIKGELVTLANPVSALKRLDRLEGFDPGGQSFYARALTWVKTGQSYAVAWIYLNESVTKGSAIPTGDWTKS
ncbi:MAG: gamma-glutamylcyclotransferase [Deltaproteobacteria bacterium]|jgi:gamma-glutamylcyclotransferase (GGCT)/AIG2-like uncharacterized protein YtfP|nr:gamma-glutamylcyclotransferase [Deltaproteobacteria bacterium]